MSWLPTKLLVADRNLSERKKNAEKYTKELCISQDNSLMSGCRYEHVYE